MGHGIELKCEWELFLHDGDHAVYYTLYQHYYHYLMFVALKKGFSASKAKDAFNEVFLHIWENREKLGHINHHHNYLVTAFLRKLYKREKLITEDLLAQEMLPEFIIRPSVESDYIAKGTQQELSRTLNNFIGKLPERQRSLIYQKFYLDLSYQEIADANNISINTVYNTIYNAVDKLKKSIGEEQLRVMSLGLAAILTLFLFFLIKH
ncbi:RNA polymerase sigma factor [Pedobacter frigoris]|uniref:RNA polymerase sigma factor n=1 Tax=Pedobacter frigoris TaxID=2571272 RepID=UPI002930461A|nr:sigma-70 family RNA polymerase sigma factor [Pedobacter frigoris]